MAMSALSSMSFLVTSMAGVSRVSPVSFLKAKPRMAIFLPETVLNMLETMFCAAGARAAPGGAGGGGRGAWGVGRGAPRAGSGGGGGAREEARLPPVVAPRAGGSGGGGRAWAKRVFCQSFITMTWCQYSATSGRPKERQR